MNHCEVFVLYGHLFVFVRHDSAEIRGLVPPCKGKNGRLATAGAALAERPWGSIRRDGLPARLGAYWEGGWQAFVR